MRLSHVCTFQGGLRVIKDRVTAGVHGLGFINQTFIYLFLHTIFSFCVHIHSQYRSYAMF